MKATVFFLTLIFSLSIFANDSEQFQAATKAAGNAYAEAKNDAAIRMMRSYWEISCKNLSSFPKDVQQKASFIATRMRFQKMVSDPSEFFGAFKKASWNSYGERVTEANKAKLQKVIDSKIAKGCQMALNIIETSKFSSESTNNQPLGCVDDNGGPLNLMPLMNFCSYTLNSFKQTYSN